MEWLDQGWITEPAEIREANISVAVILAEDEQACKNSRKELVLRTIPMNYNAKVGMNKWQEYKGYLIAPPGAIRYCKEKGAYGFNIES